MPVPAGKDSAPTGQSLFYLFLRWEKLWAGVVFTGLAFLYFGEMVSNDRFFSGPDIISFFIPQRLLWLSQIQHSTFPLWNPHILAGTPLFATLQPAVLYPFSLFYFVFPFFLAFNLIIILHYALAGAFMYALMRGQKCSVQASLISAIIYMFCGYMVTVQHYLSTFMPVVWVPLLVLVFLAGLKTARYRRAMAAGLVGTFMFLAGGVETCYQVFGFLTVFALFPRLLFDPADAPPWKTRLIFLSVFYGVFFGLSAVQFLPTLELAQLSSRAAGLVQVESTSWSMRPQDILQFFLLDPFGYLVDAQNSEVNQVWLRSLYLGALPFFLSWFYFRRGGTRAMACLTVIVLSFWIALGSYGGLHTLLYDYFPFFSIFRYPVKFIFPAVFVLCLTAGWGWDRFLEETEGEARLRKRWGTILIALGTVCMVLFGGIHLYRDELHVWMTGHGWGPPLFNAAYVNLFNMKRLLVILALFTLFLFLYLRMKKGKRVWLYAALVLLAGDLIFSGWGFYQTHSVAHYTKTTDLMKLVKSDPERARVHILEEVETGGNGRIVKSFFRGQDIRGSRVPLPIRTEPGVDQADGWAVMRQIRSMNFVNMISASPLENRLNLLSMVNVKYLVARSDLDWEGLRPVDFTSKEYPELKVYENTRRLPRAFWVPHCIVATTHRDFGRIMVNREFDPARLVVLERSPKDRPCQKPPGDDQGTGKVRLLNRGYDHLELESDAAAPGFLFLSESYYPGWRATVDGAPATIHRANYKFRALVLPAGRHRIQMEYRPVSFRLGAMVSGFTILICAGFLIKRWH